MYLNQAKAWLYDHWRLLAEVLGIILLIVIVFQGCEKDRETRKKARQDQREIQKLDRELKERMVQWSKDSADSEETIRQMDTLIQEMNIVLNEKENVLARQFIRIRQLQRSAGEVKSPADTTEYSRKMDSAALEIISLSSNYVKVTRDRDSLMALIRKKDSVQNTFIRQLKGQNTALNTAYLEVLHKYNILYDDFMKLDRKAKGRKFLNRVLAVAVLTASGAAIAK